MVTRFQVREVLEKKEAAPEETQGTPMINTPNRPPPPRSHMTSGLTTPNRPSGSGLTTPNRPSGSGLTTPNRRPGGSGLTTPNRPSGSGLTTPNRPSGSGLTTPNRPSGSGLSTPNRAGGSNFTTPNRPVVSGQAPNLFGPTTPARKSTSSVLTTPVRRPVKRTSSETGTDLILVPDWLITSHVTQIMSSDWLLTCFGRFLTRNISSHIIIYTHRAIHISIQILSQFDLYQSNKYLFYISNPYDGIFVFNHPPEIRISDLFQTLSNPPPLGTIARHHGKNGIGQL
eukprot:sb/3467780/